MDLIDLYCDRHSLILHFIAPLFSKVNAALTTPESGHEMRQMFETLLKDILTMRKKGGRTSDGRDIVIPKGHYSGES